MDHERDGCLFPIVEWALGRTPPGFYVQGLWAYHRHGDSRTWSFPTGSLKLLCRTATPAISFGEERSVEQEERTLRIAPDMEPASMAPGVTLRMQILGPNLAPLLGISRGGTLTDMLESSTPVLTEGKAQGSTPAMLLLLNCCPGGTLILNYLLDAWSGVTGGNGREKIKENGCLSPCVCVHMCVHACVCAVVSNSL